MRVESKSIVLSSKNSEFKTHLYPQIQLDQKGTHELALIGLDMYNSIPNIDHTNNIFRYEYQNTLYNIELPIGSYEIDDINDYIQKKVSETLPENLFEIRANYNTLKCIIDIKVPDLKIHFRYPTSLKDVLGFQPIMIEGIAEHEGINTVNILKVNSILVNCNIIQGSYLNNSQRPILYNFFPNVPPGYKIVEKPNAIVYLPVTQNVIDDIKIWLTDQDRNPLNLRGEVVTIRLHLRSTFYN